MMNRPSATVPLSQDVLLKLFNRLQTKENTVFHNTEIPVDRFDILFLMQQVFKQKSVFSGVSIAGSKLVGIGCCGDVQEFTRWDLNKLPTLDNLVVGTVEECKKHEQEGLDGMDISERNRIQSVLDLLANQEERDKCYYLIVCLDHIVNEFYS